MPRRPLDSEHETVTCTVRLTLGTRNALDQARGKTSRSEYLRALITQALEMKTEEPVLKNEIKKLKPAIRVKPTCDHTWARGNIFDRCVKCEETRRH